MNLSESTIFGEDYFLRGKDSGLSNFDNYRWLPKATIPVCRLITHYLEAQTNREKPVEDKATGGFKFVPTPDTILDFGCARGFYVKALRGLGFDAWGYDISEWAVANCDPSVKEQVTNRMEILASHFDFILCKDVLEHIEQDALGQVIEEFIEFTMRAALIIVPLAFPAEKEGEKQIYVSPVDRLDVTHKIAWTLPQWLLFIQGIIDKTGRAFTVTGSYKMPGVKRAADPWPCSCGFLQMKRFDYE